MNTQREMEWCFSVKGIELEARDLLYLAIENNEPLKMYERDECHRVITSWFKFGVLTRAEALEMRAKLNTAPAVLAGA